MRSSPYPAPSLQARTDSDRCARPPYDRATQKSFISRPPARNANWPRASDARTPDPSPLGFISIAAPRDVRSPTGCDVRAHPFASLVPATVTMPAPYEIRAGGDAGKKQKQSMADLKLRRLKELNTRLQEDLERPRIKVSEASMR